ncbi:hypothetical protein OIU78_004256 [Salix suchowensis]|nr:hypothetical protein OIU78_004256 [Salix suchowensis]
MGSWNSASAAILAVLALLSSILAVDLDHTTENEGVGRRALLSFKETPHGTNLTFDCSPSGPCVPCAYSEKSDEKYRCSETGHRIPFKCVEINHDSNIEKGKQRSPNGRSAVEISDDPRDGSQAYITYRSCISVNSENLSVLGFEARRRLDRTWLVVHTKGNLQYIELEPKRVDF